MPETMWSLMLAFIALLPGALYTWSLERQIGRWRTGLSDRLARFAAGSAFFHLLLLPLTYWLYSRFVVTDEVAAGTPLPLWLWGAVASYAIIPMMVGRAVGSAHRGGRKWVIHALGPKPAPTAWDHCSRAGRWAGYV